MVSDYVTSNPALKQVINIPAASCRIPRARSASGTRHRSQFPHAAPRSTTPTAGCRAAPVVGHGLADPLSKPTDALPRRGGHPRDVRPQHAELAEPTGAPPHQVGKSDRVLTPMLVTSVLVTWVLATCPRTPIIGFVGRQRPNLCPHWCPPSARWPPSSQPSSKPGRNCPRSSRQWGCRRILDPHQRRRDRHRGADRGPVAHQLLFVRVDQVARQAPFDGHDLAALYRHRSGDHPDPVPTAVSAAESPAKLLPRPTSLRIS